MIRRVLEIGIIKKQKQHKGEKKMKKKEDLNYPVWQGVAQEIQTDELNENINDSSSNFMLTQLATMGDMLAFEELYNRHHLRVYSLCLRMLQNTYEAEDLTQDVFIQLYHKIGSYRGDVAFTSWLHTLTINQVLMHFRKRTVKFEKTTEDDEIVIKVSCSSKDQTKVSILDKIALDNAIEQLPVDYRNVFVLHDVECYDAEEVARILGCKITTVEIKLHKARLKMRKLLQELRT